MPALADTDIADLVAGTLKELGRMRFQQIAQTIQDYEVMQKWLRKDKVVFDSGVGIQRTLMTKLPTAARHVGLYAVDDVNVVDLLEQMNIPWRHATTNWGFERRETLMNRGKALVVNIIAPRRAAAMINLIEELEEKGWALPGATNTTEPYGMPYWVVKNATTGFNGGNPSGHSATGAINRTTTPAFKNYTWAYTTVSKADLISDLRTAHRKTGWKSPVTIQDYRGGKGERRRLYVNETTIRQIEDVGEAQNENLGRDIASMDGTIVFRKHPIVWVPYLDTDTAYPVYMIDHATFYPVVLRGDYLRESSPRIAANQHNVFEVHVDLTYNYLCIDPRRNAVGYIA